MSSLEALQKRTAELESALESLRAADEAKSRLLTLFGKITAQHTVDDVCRVTVEGVRELLGFERAGLFLWEEDIRTFRGTFGTDLELRTVDEHYHVINILPGSPEERIIAGSIVERGCKLGGPPCRPGEEHVTADLIALRLDGKLYGILSVDNRMSRRPITAQQLEHLMLMSQVLGNALEISKARRALSESEQRFSEIAESCGQWIWELDEEGCYSYSSSVSSAILGYAPTEIMGKPPAFFAADEDRAEITALFRKAISNKTDIRNIITHQRHKQGFSIVLETSGIPIVDATGKVKGFRGVHRDVTRENELENQLRHSQKIDAIGRLAGGIAHDFNNLLTAILGCSSLLLEEMAKDDPKRADILRIQSAGERAATLTRQLLAFSRRQTMCISMVNANEVVREMEKILRRTIGEDIELRIELARDMREIRSDADQLKQALLHLCINGRDAMVDPTFLTRAPTDRALVQEQIGRLGMRPKVLLIRTAQVALDEQFCNDHAHLQPGLHVSISVRDTGIGIPPEVREHLFEPFFTTKEVGQGSGLGLPTVYGIVRQMGGEIVVESELGKGSNFTIYLPVVEDEGGAAGDASAKCGHETILLVEDEDVVRGLTARMLESAGYRVLQACDGEAAIRVFRNSAEPVHLVLTDMIMPHLGGRQFVEELRKTGKDIKVLYVSGYGGDDSPGGRLIGNDVPLIQKPFARDVLAAKVREVLDGGS